MVEIHLRGFGKVKLDCPNNSESEVVLEQDICVKRMVAMMIDERLGNNNWRKMHGLPMWRLR